MLLAACSKEISEEILLSTEGEEEAFAMFEGVLETPEESASLDFEDGKTDFAAVIRASGKSDASELSVAEVGESNALVCKNVQGKEEVYIGFDLTALLGAEIEKVYEIQYDIGVLGDRFYAVCGTTNAYSGVKNDRIDQTEWSVYLESNNPKTVSVKLKYRFSPKANNYFVISKSGDNCDSAVSDGQPPRDIYIDNISFFDSEGNLILADSSAAVSQESPLFMSRFDGEFSEGDYVDLDSAYAGDWGYTSCIPAEYFEGAVGDVTITLKYKLEQKSYYLLKPVTATEMIAIEKSSFSQLPKTKTGRILRFQTDGFIAIDDKAADSFTFSIDSETAAMVASQGGMCFQTYGLVLLYAVVSK